MTTDKLASLFGMLREPVIAARGKEIIYRNTAAAQHAALSTLPFTAIVPGYVHTSEQGSFLTELEVAGTLFSVSGSAWPDNIVVLVFSDNEDEDRALQTSVIASSVRIIREPLSLLKYSADYILPKIEEVGDEKSRKYTSMMYRGIFGTMRGINRLDAFTDLHGETFSMMRTPTHFDLVRICAEVVETVRGLLDLPPERLVFETKPDSRMVYAERHLIERMILCLIDNALRFTEPNNVISLSIRDGAGRAIIVVSDDGEGISDAARQNIWSRYSQWTDLTDTKRGGGFGLSLVQSIARRHGGGTLIESNPGEGTSVIVSIEVEDTSYGVFEEKEHYGSALTMAEIFTELVDHIPPKKFTPRYFD